MTSTPYSFSISFTFSSKLPKKRDRVLHAVDIDYLFEHSIT